MKSFIKGSFFKNHLDQINGKQKKFYNERKHMINTYGIEEELVNAIFDNWDKCILANIEPGDYNPDYKYEKDMLDSFEEFKNELIYDGYYDLARIIKLHHFYSFFSFFYYPQF